MTTKAWKQAVRAVERNGEAILPNGCKMSKSGTGYNLYAPGIGWIDENATLDEIMVDVLKCEED